MKYNSNFVDIINIGAGPAGLAFACMFDEEIKKNKINFIGKFICLEKYRNSEWHPNLLLQNTDINHHVYRDLVTPRNPQSPYSFAMYLKENNRLFKFGLLGRPASRVEWSDYMKWAAQKLSKYIEYNRVVDYIQPVLKEGVLTSMIIGGNGFEFETRKIILSNGSTPYIPTVFNKFIGDRIFHTSSYLKNLQNMKHNLPKRWLVLGSGQSAGEVVMDLIGKHSDIHVTSLHRSIGFKIAQQGQFPNLAFLPEYTDYYRTLSPNKKVAFFQDIKGTNYSGIDVDESQQLYSAIYEDEILGRERITMEVNSEINSLDYINNEYVMVIQDKFTGVKKSLFFDACVIGTGYFQPKIPALLNHMEAFLEKDYNGDLLIDDEYRIALSGKPDVFIYINGLSERTHGISNAQSFSAVALRAEQIYQSIEKHNVLPDNYFI
ncbi:SidA/IucD/PvdA family monooxygenase [Xenorhabdus siamensis]|uniref:SidA/IucD/PvdA family monooxygenase n=1 Tax=Xenorhabdus siamensis TaxID=3136254 RepID=UPI0030F3F7A6